MPYPEYAAGFSFSISLRNRSAQADNVRAQLELQQQQTTRIRTENQIRVDVENAVVALTQAKAQVEAAQQAVQASKAALDAEQTKLTTGISTAYRVIQFERDYVASQSQQIQAQANYAKARVQLDRVRGTVLEHNNIPLNDLFGGR
jgi:outer membrane protein TolC